MPNSPTYLLDTGILLHWVRGSDVAEVIEGQFQLRASNFRPLICEVTLGEIEAFARSEKCGEQKSYSPSTAAPQRASSPPDE